MYIAVLDAHEQIVTHIHGDIVYTHVYEVGTLPSHFPPTLRHQTTGEWRNGVFKFERATFTGTPGKSYKIEISSSHVDPDLPDTKAFVSSSGMVSSSLSIFISLRHCKEGEGFLSDGRC